MKDYEVKLRAYEALLGKEDEDSAKKRNEILDWLKANESAEAKAYAEAMIKRHLDDTDKMIGSIRRQIGSKYEILPISYIARHYFGKSAAWLHQRINGYPVRGKVYTLSPEQKEIFNAACRDISQKIGSLHFV